MDACRFQFDYSARIPYLREMETAQMTKEEIKKAALKAEQEEREAFASVSSYKTGPCRSAMLRKAEKLADLADNLWAAYFRVSP